MKLEEIKDIGVIGAGTMGPGIAQVFALNGYRVKIYTRRHETLTQAASVVKTNLDLLAKMKVIKAKDIRSILHRMTFTNSIQEAGEHADLILETVIEDPKVKREVFASLDRLCSPEAIFLSNTSNLNIFNLVNRPRLPNLAICHWFAPPHIIPLVEVVRGPETRDATVQLTVSTLKKMGKIPMVIERFIPGFVINRILRIMGREIFYLIDNGYVSPEQLDLAVKTSIAPRMMVLGLVQRYDFTGLDLSLRNLQNAEFFDPPINNNPKALVERVQKGDLGVKTGKGFYDYEGRKYEGVSRDRDLYLLKVLKALSFCTQKNRLV